jgi:tetraacyldisaccharide 4'-kinase
VAWAEHVEAAFSRLWWRREPSAGSLPLRPLSWCYGAVTALRRGAYRAGWLETRRASVPVLVVGNLVAGGAGKTPAVIALVQALRRAGHTPGVISRGHGRQGALAAAVQGASRAAEVGDEPLLIHRRTGVPVWVARRRIDAARGLCAAHPEVDLLVCDDGLQHLGLARDVQVIVFDERGIGNGHVLPVGPLRETMPAHVPVNSHVLYNAPMPSTQWPGAGAAAAVRRGGAGRLVAGCCAEPRAAVGAARTHAVCRGRHGRAAALLCHASGRWVDDRCAAAARPP